MTPENMSVTRRVSLKATVASAPRRICQQSHGNIPSNMKEVDMALPTQDTFTAEHEEIEKAMKAYALTKRGRRNVEAQTMECWTREGAAQLRSNSARARIEFMKAATAELASRRWRPQESFFFITLAPRQFAVRIEDAATFDHESVKTWAAGLLHGLDYVGIVEAAYYSNYSVEGGEKGKPAVSWHVHALLWGTDADTVDAIKTWVTDRYQPLLPRGKVAHVRALGYGGARSRLIYMLKGQTKEYRVYPFVDDDFDLETGEVTTSGKWRQRKRPMRKVDLARMYGVIGERTIPTLCFAGGAGEPMLGAAEAKARQALTDENTATERRLRPIRDAVARLS